MQGTKQTPRRFVMPTTPYTHVTQGDYNWENMPWPTLQGWGHVFLPVSCVRGGMFAPLSNLHFLPRFNRARDSTGPPTYMSLRSSYSAALNETWVAGIFQGIGFMSYSSCPLIPSKVPTTEAAAGRPTIPGGDRG